ncbi:hypothetical protein AMES_5176 [Amycolatopsis mediterranei S699]|uniref:Uncharacterized protein n=2 Tax=Amycolatopsis mediterranei TaxID=33910 RepID=A0A0H3D8M8_AMYMU|nr:hypothetical protein [Amycolatopsis mediterranei]ADJ47001.1 hypothetical protein AMED_5238 [Amycolatopsis mediterranei U32]AEK43813.1 hypothetical protein RAM_26680 [Amycolatopsis mediterranei S699]AFO78712.1 hypothetical protein AMES_5176 [Amycolatopsis mediterranei S699]AGT85840.1 hypothetical protein B737_5176 [Amycolatopsis mediterranei RB]KDO04913.1 hypothetical protein DV26_41895 [Amycolatopsis mediterranei]
MTEETAATAQALQATMQMQAATTPEAKTVAALRVGLAGAQLKRLAQTGGFAIDDTTGNQLIEALEGVLESLEQRWANLQRLHDAPALSRTATGQWVSAHMVSTAADEHGLVTQLQAARQEFPTYIEAIKLAKQNYKSREETTRTTLTSLPAADQS